MKRTISLLLVSSLFAVGSIAVGVAVGRVNPRMTADGQPPPPPVPWLTADGQPPPPPKPPLPPAFAA